VHRRSWFFASPVQSRKDTTGLTPNPKARLTLRTAGVDYNDTFTCRHCVGYIPRHDMSQCTSITPVFSGRKRQAGRILSKGVDRSFHLHWPDVPKHCICLARPLDAILLASDVIQTQIVKANHRTRLERTMRSKGDVPRIKAHHVTVNMKISLTTDVAVYLSLTRKS